MGNSPNQRIDLLGLSGTGAAIWGGIVAGGARGATFGEAIGGPPGFAILGLSGIIGAEIGILGGLIPETLDAIKERDAARIRADEAAEALKVAIQAKIKRCRDYYKNYDAAKKEQRNIPGLDNIKCCADAILKRNALQREVDNRQNYQDEDCDSVIPTEVKHDIELAAKKTALERAKNLVKELCPP